MCRKGRAELLAPAGNAEGFYGAVHAGADAVYLGGSRFGARAYAENFTTEELIECIRYGHLFGRKIYLTVNTLLKESELSELFDYLNPFYEAGLDAVIVQDLGVLRFVRDHFPGLGIHGSTQMTICGVHGAELLKSLGVGRIVPARELSLQELSEMKDKAAIELETFIHGAMCYCYSGQCLFSSILGGRSGNRGRCAQPCRLPYKVRTKRKQSETCYPLSLKDMCTIEHIPRLAEAGIDSFKIEGRMKKPEYAAGVTAIYRKYIDQYYGLRERYGAEKAAAQYKVLPEDLDILSSLYIRSGKQDGYYFKQNGEDMITLSDPAYSGSDARILQDIKRRYLDSRIKVPIAVSGTFLAGIPAKVTLQTGELSVTVEGAVVEKAQKQPVTEENLRKQLGKMGDSVFIPQNMNLNVRDNIFYPLRQINELRREAVSGLERSLLEKNGYKPRESGKNNDLLREKAAESGTKSSLQQENAQESGTKSSLLQEYTQESGIKGSLLQEYAKGIEKEHEGNKYPHDYRNIGWKDYNPGEHGTVIGIRTLEQLQVVVEGISKLYEASEGKHLAQKTRYPKYRLKRLYVDGDLLLERTPEAVALCGKMDGAVPIFIALPYILRKKDDNYLACVSEIIEKYPMFCGVLARSLDGFAYALEKGYRNRLDANVYCWNSLAWEELKIGTAGFCLPLELKATEQRKLLERCKASSEGQSFEKIVYGRIPMMVTANCLSKTIEGCRPENEGRTELIDRYHKEFPVIINCRHCINIIYNSVPLSLHQDLRMWSETTDIRLDFTIESGTETKEVLRAFLAEGEIPYKEYTTGHEKRGVE